MKLFAYTTVTFINCFLLGVNGQGQYGNNNGYNPGNPQGAFGNPMNDFYNGLRNQIGSSLLKPNVFNVYGTGSGLPVPQYQDQYPYAGQGYPPGGYQNPNQHSSNPAYPIQNQYTGNPAYPNQNQFGNLAYPSQNQFSASPAYQNQYPYGQGQNQGQFNNPNAYQQHGIPPNQQQNFQGPQNAQPPVQQRENLAGQSQGVPPAPSAATNNIPSNIPSKTDNIQTNPIPPPTPNIQNPAPNNTPAPALVPQNIDARQELNVKPNESNPSSTTDAEDELILKEFNQSPAAR